MTAVLYFRILLYLKPKTRNMYTVFGRVELPTRLYRFYDLAGFLPTLTDTLFVAPDISKTGTSLFGF